ncbi:hypothetical protein BT69DRAFT_547409 [Atractiella rhizophila]|nr:hypothetical protein BT69DRAFT_547409 [Atractiella rhizophila]
MSLGVLWFGGRRRFLLLLLLSRTIHIQVLFADRLQRRLISQLMVSHHSHCSKAVANPFQYLDCQCEIALVGVIFLETEAFVTFRHDETPTEQE